MIKRLRMKFVCINMTIVTAMLLVIFGMVLHFTAENLEQQSVGMLQSVVDNRAKPGRPVQPREVQLPWFRVTRDMTGKLIVHSGGYETQPEEETVRAIMELVAESGEQRGILKEQRLRYSRVPGPFGEELVFVDISGEIDTMQSLAKTCAFVGVVSFGAFLVLSLFLAKWAIHPVEVAWEQQRQFVADASHELKTPLTVIITNAELLQDPAYDSEARRGFSESILTMSVQMRFLVERLLDLARLDNGSSKLQFSRVDLSGLVWDGVLPFEPVYFERHLQLESEVAEGVAVRGSLSHLKQVLDILLDNGAKYTTPGGTVCVSLRRQGGSCLLTVAGPGDPISRENLKNIFKRFYRVDKARSRDGSYGLGLAIAERIVSEHGGKIWAESEMGINTFFVLLPVI